MEAFKLGRYIPSMQGYSGLFLLACSLSFCGCSKQENAIVHQVTLSNGELTAVICDNDPYNDHHSGYNGIASLIHTQESTNIFRSDVAGINLEHYSIDGRDFGLPSRVGWLLPRNVPMTLNQIDERTAELYQSVDTLGQIDVRVRFQLSPPHYIDITVTMKIQDERYSVPYFGLFFASYIHEPENKNSYFLGREQPGDAVTWIHTMREGRVNERGNAVNTYLYEKNSDNERRDKFLQGVPQRGSPSHEETFGYPFFYGRWRDMVFIVMCEQSEPFYITQVPRGGGALSPAWDFGILQGDFTVKQPFVYNLRVTYKQFVDLQDIIREYEQWKYGSTVIYD